MEEMWQWGLVFIHHIQQFQSPALDKFFILMTSLGAEVSYLVLFAFILWCVHFKLGSRVRWLFVLSVYINILLKLMFQMARPFHLSPAVQLIAAEGYGFPSGAAQSSVLVLCSIAYGLKSKIMWYVALFLSFLIGVSRIYLGVHFPHGVLGGWLIGFFIFYVYHYYLEPKLATMVKPIQNLKIKILAASLFSLLSVIFLIVDDTLTIIGTLVGMSWGFVINSHFLFFQEAGGNIYQRSLRFMIGVTGIMLLYFGLKVMFPGPDQYGYKFWQFIRYMLLGFWICAGAPWVFYRLSLAGKGIKNNEIYSKG